MHYLSIDQCIVAIFLLFTLLIGLLAGRGIKDIREYAIANRMFGTGALVLTWLATDIAGRDYPGYGGFCEDNRYFATFDCFWGLQYCFAHTGVVFRS